MIPCPGYYDSGAIDRVSPGPITLPSSPHTSAEWQIAAYSSAAPDFLGGAATVMGPDGKTVLRKGTNGWTCMPTSPDYDESTGWASPAAAAPVCLPDSGFPWLQAWVTGTTPKVDRDVFVWMLNGDLGFDNTDATVTKKADAKDLGSWVQSGPHLMLMPKDPASLDKFTTDFKIGEPYVMFKGSPCVCASGSNPGLAP